MFHVGDTASALTFICENYNRRTRTATPANLTGATLEVHLKRPNRTVLDVVGVIDGDPLDGEGKYEWQTGDLTVAGNWEYEVEVTYSDTKIQTFGPDNFPVLRQIA